MPRENRRGRIPATTVDSVANIVDAYHYIGHGVSPPPVTLQAPIPVLGKSVRRPESGVYCASTLTA